MIYLLAIILCFAVKSNAEVYHHGETGFTMRVPEQWTAVERPFSIFHFRDVYVAFNNIGDKDLQVKEWREGNIETCGSYAVSKQLDPGTIYLDVGLTSGPPPIMPSYKWFPEDGLAHRKAELLELREPHYEAGVVSYKLQFHRFGEVWDIRVYCREPFNQLGLEAAFEAMASIEFVEGPILTSAQAVEAAIPFLPAEAQPKREWVRGGCDMFFNYKIDTESVADTFVVRIVKLDGSEDRKPVQTYEYRVYQEGRVEFLGKIEGG